MKNPMIKWGVYYGLASVVVTILLYLIDKTLLFNGYVSTAVGLGLAILFLVLAMKETRTNNEGFLGYGEAVKIGLVTFAIGALIGSIASFVLFNYVDPSLGELEKEMAIETTIKTMESMASMFGADTADLEEIKEQAIEDVEAMGDQHSVSATALNWIIAVFMSLILSLIVGAFMKKSS